MTATIGRAVTGYVIQLLTGAGGANAYLGGEVQDNGLPLAPLHHTQVRAQNVAWEIADQSSTMQYPAINVYCEKIVNNLAEKFRSLSGSVQTTVELRHSQDRLDGLQDALASYTDAILQVLTANRGDWGDGLFYSGEYQVGFGPIKHGGKNFQQAAKITFEIGVSRS